RKKGNGEHGEARGIIDQGRKPALREQAYGREPARQQQQPRSKNAQMTRDGDGAEILENRKDREEQTRVKKGLSANWLETLSGQEQDGRLENSPRVAFGHWPTGKRESHPCRQQ